MSIYLTTSQFVFTIYSMMQLHAINGEPDDVQARYRDNFARHLLGVTLYLQSSIMNALTREQGHKDLRINFEPYINIIGDQGARLSDIADALAVSRQAANQTANQIEAAGYITREADPSDGRAKLLVATARGRALRRDGAREAAKLQRQLEAVVGEQDMASTLDTLQRLNGGLGLLLPAPEDMGQGRQAWLAALLPRLRDHVIKRLMHLTAGCGHPALKQSFGQVLTAIGPRGGRIQQMAQAHGVSKQAVSAVATELEVLGYIHRQADASDARQLVLHFTDRGRGLIADSVASVDALYQEFAGIVGEQPLQGLCSVLREFYRALHLEEDIFGNSAAVDIRVLAKQLKQQLGEEGGRALAQLLLSGSQEEA